MTSLLKYTKLASAALLAGTVATSATVLDFTTAGFEAGALGSNTWTLTGDPTPAVPGDSLDGSGNPTANAVAASGITLELDFDGIGIGVKGTGTNPDEVDGAESLTLEFKRNVKITGVYFLDLFISDDADATIETAAVTSDLGGGVMTDAVEVYRERGGFSFSDGLKLKGSTFTFFDPTGGNDNVGVGDFALAAVTVEAVPLPAGFLLLGTALGGLGLARRRKKA